MTRTLRTTCWFTIGEERYGPADVTLTQRPVFANRKVSFRVEGIFTLEEKGLPLEVAGARLSLPDGRQWEVAFTERTSERAGAFTAEGKLF